LHRSKVDAELPVDVKVVHLETGRHFYGGPQQVIWLMRGLRALGIENVLVCPPEAAIAEEAQADDFEVTEIQCLGDVDIKFAASMRRWLRSANADLMHSHSRRGADVLGGWAADRAGVPAVLSRRVDNPESPPMVKLRYRWYRKIIAISDNVAAALDAQSVPADRVTVIRDAVDTGIFDDAADRTGLQLQFGIPSTAYTIAVVAQLIPRKGHRFLFDVLPGLCKKYPQIKVVIFGEGPAEDDLKALCRRLGLSGAVQFAGFRRDLDDYLAAFDLLVHPAEKEGMGVAMLKAAAAGLPVLAFDMAGAREAVQNGLTGVLVPPGDLEGLQSAIEMFLLSPDKGRQLGEAGRARMLAEFSVDAMAEQHRDLYVEVLNG